MPPLEAIGEGNQWYSNPGEQDYEVLHKRALDGEVDEWHFEGYHLFAHPEHANGRLLGLSAIVEGIVNVEPDAVQPTLLVETPATRAWKDEQERQRLVEVDKRLTWLLDSFEKVKNGELYAYHVIEATPVTAESPKAVAAFIHRNQEDLFSIGVRYTCFDVSSDLEEVAVNLKLQKWPSLIIPVTADDLENVTTREVILNRHNAREAWVEEDALEFRRADAEMAKSFSQKSDTWRIYPRPKAT